MPFTAGLVAVLFCMLAAVWSTPLEAGQTALSHAGYRDLLPEAWIRGSRHQKVAGVLPRPLVPAPQSLPLTVRPVLARPGRSMSIATGAPGGIYRPLGEGLASILGKALPGVTATVLVTGGSVANVQLIGSGKADIGFTQVDVAWDARNGLGRFSRGKQPIRALAVLYANYLHVVTVEGTGVARLEDLKGKRVSTGIPGSASEVYALRLLRTAGISPDKDIRRERLSLAQGVNALKSRQIDALFWVGGLPTAALGDLAAAPNSRLKLIDVAHLTPRMNASYGRIYAAATIPAAAYQGIQADGKTNAIWNILVAHPDMPDQVAYAIARVVIEWRAELARVHKEALNIRPEWQTSDRAGIPWHPGALKYFNEKGIKVE